MNMKFILCAALLSMTTTSFADGVGDVGSGVTKAKKDLTVQCHSGATLVTLWSSELEPTKITNPTPDQGEYTGIQTLTVKADGFTVHSDMAAFRIENNKMIWQSLGGDIAGIAVSLNKTKKKAQLVRIETDGTVVKKNLDCVVLAE